VAGVGWPWGKGTLLAMPTGDVCQGYRMHQPPKRRCHLQFQVPTRCETRLPSQLPIIWIIFGCLEGRLDSKECDARTLADMHVWLLLFADDFVLTSKSEVGLQQQLDTLQ
jgi:hypothetical protein